VSPRKIARQARSSATVEAIYSAAARILLEEGYAGVTTNHIAVRAGVSVGSLYQYFPNKDAIVLGLLERLIEEERAMIERCLLETRGQGVEQLVRRLVEETFDFFSVKGELRHALFEQTPEHIRRNRPHLLLKRLSRAILAMFREHRLEMKRKASLLDVYLVVCAVEASLREAVYRYRRKIDRARMVEDVSELVLRYLTMR
jgi:AcrR family transcriptional regulator